MKNINENQKESKEANEINVGKVWIYEHAESEAGNVNVELQIPYRFNLSGRRSLSEYKKISIGDLQVKANICFELITFLSFQLMENDKNAAQINEFINLTGVIGKGLIEATEVVGMDFERYRKAENEKLIDAPAPEVKRQPKQPKAKTLAEHHLQVMANKLSHIFASEKAIDAKEALQSIICQMPNEANIGIDSPELIKTSFPLLVNSLEIGHAKGFVQSIAALFDSGLVAPIEDELDQYHKRFDSRDSEPEVLDVPDSSMEDLAQKLSDIMHDPHLPKKIHNCLADELAGNCIDFRTPENILGNLKQLSNEKSES